MKSPAEERNRRGETRGSSAGSFYINVRLTERPFQNKTLDFSLVFCVIAVDGLSEH